jgi:pyruvate formate lyase activating enzyme
VGIKGFQGTSLLDYPGRIAALVFYGDCNLFCPFCHNPDLVRDPDALPDYPLDDLFEELTTRRNFIDGVVVSGGEPTLDDGLLPLLRRIRKLGLLIKLDTNGLRPEVLAQVLGEQLADRVALDLKTAPHRYVELHGRREDGLALQRSVGLLLKGTAEYEFRTTCVPGLVEEQDIRQLGELLHGARGWVLQQFVPRYCLAETCRTLEPYPAQKLERLAEVAREYVPEVSLRGL